MSDKKLMAKVMVPLLIIAMGFYSVFVFNTILDPLLAWIYFIFSVTTIIMFLAIIFHGFTRSATKKPDRKLFDLWSLAHFFAHLILTLIVYYWLANYDTINLFPDGAVFTISIGFSIVSSVVWEIGESVGEKKKGYNRETKRNRLSDIVYGAAGTGLAALIIIYSI